MNKETNYRLRKLAKLYREYDLQREWISDHGGDIHGYNECYGSRNDTDHYGEGGEEIFYADLYKLLELHEAVGKALRNLG